MNDRNPLRATSFSRPLPEKKYFKIGEVAALVGVEPHVLRYWETQFSQLRPHKARSGHRLYRRRELEVLLVIRELLHVQRFTIAGARQALRQQPGLAQSLLPTAALASDTMPPSSSPSSIDATLDEADPIEDDASAEALESVEVAALDGEELEEAMEAQRHDQHTAGLVGFDVEPAPVSVARAAPPPTSFVRPAHTAAALGGALDLGGHAASAYRRSLEDALADARGLLALLDDLDAKAANRAL